MKPRGSIERDKIHGSDKLPEWLDDGPTSMTDVIELKGFDEDMPDKGIFREFNS